MISAQTGRFPASAISVNYGPMIEFGASRWRAPTTTPRRYRVGIHHTARPPEEPAGYYPAPSGFGGLAVACWPLVPKFAGSNAAEAVGFFRAKKILSTLSFGREAKTICPMSWVYGM